MLRETCFRTKQAEFYSLHGNELRSIFQCLRGQREKRGLVIFVFIFTEVDRGDWKEFLRALLWCESFGKSCFWETYSGGSQFLHLYGSWNLYWSCKIAPKCLLPMIYPPFHCHFCNNSVSYVYTLLMVSIILQRLFLHNKHQILSLKAGLCFMLCTSWI